MKVAFFSTHSFEKEFFIEQNKKFLHDLHFFDLPLNEKTAFMAQGFEVVCCFVSDHLNAETLLRLKELSVKLVALRSAGYNHIDLVCAEKIQLPVVRVPAYSPHAVAEHAVALLLTLNRKTHKAHNRVHELNFSLDGLVGFDLYQKTVGVIGAGKIGAVFAQIMLGFGCRLLVYDKQPSAGLSKQPNVTYVSLSALLAEADIISLHVPLVPETKYLINESTMAQMKRGAILINTGRGGLIQSKALIKALKSGHLGGACLDVYEEEEGIFFKDLSESLLQDDFLARLLTFPNVVMSSHQAFLTKEALCEIAKTTLENVSLFAEEGQLRHQVHAQTFTT